MFNGSNREVLPFSFHKKYKYGNTTKKRNGESI